MVLFEEVDGKLVPKGSEEDIKAYLDYKKGLKTRARRRSLRERYARRSSAFAPPFSTRETGEESICLQMAHRPYARLAP